jgi:hypothetical protein
MKFATEKPEITRATNQKKNPLSNNENSPSVKILIGKVRILIIGFIIVLINPRTAATMTAVRKLCTCMPSIAYAAASTASESNNQCSNNFI